MISKNILVPVTILLASAILGGFFYASQVNKHRSIERQLEMKILEDRRVEEARLVQEEKKYVAKRKSECYELYEKERAKWTNVKGNQYDEEDDVCVIRYKATNEWEGKDCDDFLPDTETTDILREFMLDSYWNCQDNSFTKEF